MKKHVAALFTSLVALLLIASMVRATGEVSYWSFDEGYGLTANDTVGDHDGTLVNGPVWTTGIVGGALSFDGVDDFVEVQASPDLDLTESVSWEMWIYPRDRRGIHLMKIHDGTNPLTLFLDPFGEGNEPLHPAFEFMQDPYDNIIGWNVDVQTEQWQYIVVTFDSSTLSLYYNGELANVSYDKSLPSSNGYVSIGTGEGGDVFNGLIDEVAIYNIALTAEEVNARYNELIDSDGDGVPNGQDNCPSEDSTGFDADGNGCIDDIQGLSQVINTIPDEALSAEIKNSLESKVVTALRSVDKEKDQAAINQLQAFVNEIDAQRGKKISEEAADMLIGYANNIILLIQE